MSFTGGLDQAPIQTPSWCRIDIFDPRWIVGAWHIRFNARPRPGAARPSALTFVLPLWYPMPDGRVWADLIEVDESELDMLKYEPNPILDLLASRWEVVRAKCNGVQEATDKGQSAVPGP